MHPETLVLKPLPAEQTRLSELYTLAVHDYAYANELVNQERGYPELLVSGLHRKLGILGPMEPCEEKSRLADEFIRTSEAYSNTAKALRAAIHADYTKALDDIRETSIHCGNALRALQAHIMKHRC